MRSATNAAGTRNFWPLSFQPAPSFVAFVAGASGSALFGSCSAALRITSPATTPGSQRFCCAALPNFAIGSAPHTSVAHAGTGATVRPISSSSTHSSKKP